MRDEQLLLVIGNVLHRKANRRHRNVDDQIDLVDIVPAPRDAAADVGLELVVADDDADRLAEYLAAEIVDRHLRGGDRALTGRRRCRTVHVGEDADLDHVVGNLRERGGRRQQRGREYSEPGWVPGEHLRLLLPVESARWPPVFRRLPRQLVSFATIL